MKTLFYNGVTVHPPTLQSPVICKAIVLSGTCDIPAKAVALNMIGHNGFYGCPYSEETGVTVPTTGQGHVVTYPYAVAVHRNKDSVLACAKEAIESQTTVKGIHPPGSCIMSLPMYDVVKGMGIDFMHCILLNIVRKLLHLWFDTTYHSKQWSCSKLKRKADARLKSIRPPSNITCSPRSLDERKLWKASEFRSWLFYYSLPVMLSILPDEYYLHYSLLCSRHIHLLYNPGELYAKRC